MYSFIFEILLLVTALSVDAFAAGFVYGVSKIKVPFASIIVVTGISSLILVCSLLAGNLVSSLIPGNLTQYFSFLLLFVLGLTKLFDRSQHNEAETADKNKDAFVSPAEALTLGAALSIDSLAAGIGAGIGSAYIPLAFLVSFLIGALAIVTGSCLGGLISSHCRSNLCWVSGVLLILLAFMKLM